MNKNVSRSFPHNFVQPGVKIRQPDTGDAAFWHSDFVLHFLADWNLLAECYMYHAVGLCMNLSAAHSAIPYMQTSEALESTCASPLSYFFHF